MRRRRKSPPAATAPDPAAPAAQRGRLGEDLAEAHLVALGWRCVARNLRTRHGEIDLLMRRRRLYAVVEVKTRSWHPAPERLIGDDDVARLDAALRKLVPTLVPRPRRLRVDVVAVRLRRDAPPEIRHFPGTELLP